MSDHEQTAFPFYCNETKLAEFLTRWFVLEEEEDRLRDDKRVLKEAYQDAFPMRAIMAAVKIVRTRTTLAQHATEPMALADQNLLETLVATHLDRLAEETAALQAEAERIVPQMTGA
jgi:uncharacterized protein (UPF0335 family)